MNVRMAAFRQTRRLAWHSCVTGPRGTADGPGVGLAVAAVAVGACWWKKLAW